MTLGPEYEDGGKWWRDVRLWSPGDEMPKGYQFARKPGEWQNGRHDPGPGIMVGVPYRVPVIKPGPSWDDVQKACRDCFYVVKYNFDFAAYIEFNVSSPEMALRLIQAAEAPPPAEKPETPEMLLGPPYEDQGKWWQDVTSPDLKAPKPQGTQYHADGEWLDIAVNGSKFYAGHAYRIPAIAPQTATEAPAPVPPALPMTLVPTSPQPPYGSVVLVGRYPQAYQRFDRGWCPTGGTVVHSWHRLLRDNDPVILIYVPPEPAL